MRFSILSAVFACAVFGLMGCEDKAGGGDKAAGGGGGEIGVAECDEYISKYKSCLNDKVPAEAKGAMEQGMTAMVNSWKEAAKTDEGKQGLAQGCKTALESAKTAMQAYGCEW